MLAGGAPRGARRPRRIAFAAPALLALLCAAAAAVMMPRAAAAQAEEARALERVRAQIETLERRLSRRTEERDEHAAALQRAEVAVAETRRELGRLEARAAEQRARQAELEAQRAAAEARVAVEREALARQVRVSYMNGGQAFFRLLLSQEDPARLGRMMRYYEYFNRARSRRIAAVDAEVRKLAGLVREAGEVRRELDELEAATARELETLERTRGERARALEALEAAIAEDGDEIERLREEEQRLADLVVELGELLAGFPVNAEEPFPKLKGRLAWPVPGRLAGDYGERRNGGPLRWNGVLLEADRGAAVRAVYHGRVAFSDWLPGLGLLIIVDHGDGFMSLYGHNETLLKEPGDWVAPGEPIAEVGESGGRSRPALYFEIRRDGAPENPHEWMATGPEAG